MIEITIEELKKFKSKPKGLLFMENILTRRGITWYPEFKFSPDRKFRADIFFQTLLMFHNGDSLVEKYLVEYEGLPLRGAKSGHVTITGYTNNCEKYNLACLMGYKVLRYTALNYKQFELDLQKILDK